MVATLAQMASAAYYLASQRSFRHPNEYYTAGKEPDGVWWNPCGLFGLADGGRVDGGEFHRLYHGFAPGGGERLTRNAGSEKRSSYCQKLCMGLSCGGAILAFSIHEFDASNDLGELI